MNGNRPQSWNDLVVMTPMDIRSVISTASFQDQAGASHGGVFLRSTTFLHSSTWVTPPMVVSVPGVGTTAFIQAVNPTQDYDAQQEANTWNGLHLMTAPNNQLPLAVNKIIFLKAGTSFVNNIYLDWSGGTTSTSDIELSFRDNSTTSGEFQNSGTGTIPVFSFPAATYGGTGRLLTLTLLQRGKFSVCLRIIDNSGNYSMFEMDWIVL